MQITLNIPHPPKNQEIIEIPLHFCGGKVVEAGGYEFEERKIGRWITKSKRNPLCLTGKYFWRECSVCGWCREDDSTANDTPFCPTCGSQMKEGD